MSTGWRVKGLITDVPILMRLVPAAIAAHELNAPRERVVLRHPEAVESHLLRGLRLAHVVAGVRIFDQEPHGS